MTWYKDLLESIPYAWCEYYFKESFALPSRYKDVLEHIDKWGSLIWLGYRSCGKTALVRKMICKRIANKERNLIRRTSFEWWMASNNITSISNMIIWSKNSRYVQEYWSLYSSDDMQDKKYKQKEQKRITWFSTSNGVLVKANSLRKSARWLSLYLNDKTLRPDCEILDDVDDDENTKSVWQIDKNFQKINSSILWGSTWQVIFLWNVIHEDGVWPRMIEQFKDDPKWMILRTKLIDNWELTRPWRFVMTDKEANEKNHWVFNQDEHVTSVERLKRKPYFMSNYMLEPIKDWSQIIEKHMIKYGQCNHRNTINVLGIDNAESERDWTARVGLVVCNIDTVARKIYVRYARPLAWKEKNTTNVWNIIHQIYDDYNINEPILIENGGGWLSLRGHLIDAPHNLPCRMFNTKLDKAQRLRRCSPFIESWVCSFDVSIDPEMIKELCTFPNYQYKDLMDALTSIILAYKDKINWKTVATTRKNGNNVVSKLARWRSWF